ncbi:MAG: hypothetical protein K1X88_14685 [Nannocystaceae bacterium]|nr:hypothetical protein [Nannocystaceae bacterium]
MSPEFYKALHLFGVFLLLCSLGGLAMTAFGGGRDEATRKRLTMLHGIAMLVVVVAGFGLMAKMGLMSTWPLWILVKLGIWLVLGAAVAFVRRMPQLGRAWIVILPAIGAVAAWAAVSKPG